MKPVSENQEEKRPIISQKYNLNLVICMLLSECSRISEFLYLETFRALHAPVIFDPLTHRYVEVLSAHPLFTSIANHF